MTNFEPSAFFPQNMEPAKVKIARSLQCSNPQHAWGVGDVAALGLAMEPAKVRAAKPVLHLDALTRPEAPQRLMLDSLRAEEIALVEQQLVAIISDLQGVARRGWSSTLANEVGPSALAEASTASPSSLLTPPSPPKSTPSLTDDDEVSELASIGSGLHHTGNCRPCKWAWSEMGCAHGATCSFCHFRHEWSDKHKRRPCKGKRTYYRKLLAKVAASRGHALPDFTESLPNFGDMALLPPGLLPPLSGEEEEEEEENERFLTASGGEPLSEDVPVPALASQHSVA